MGSKGSWALGFAAPPQHLCGWAVTGKAMCPGADLAWVQPSVLGTGVRCAPGREMSLLPPAAVLAVGLSLLGVK